MSKKKKPEQPYGKLPEPKNKGTRIEVFAPDPQNAAPKLRNNKTPVLVLTGIVGVSIAAIVIGTSNDTPDDPVVEVERARYATQEECIADWNNAADCQLVDGDSWQSVVADAASDASGARPATLMAASSTSGATSSSGAYPYHGTVHVGGGWYGPYYTHSGFVYHNNGVMTPGGVPATLHGQNSSLSMRTSSLSSDPSAFSRTPRSVSVSESRAISRGGFTSGHGSGRGSGGSRGG